VNIGDAGIRGIMSELKDISTLKEVDLNFFKYFSQENLLFLCMVGAKESQICPS